MRRYLDNPIINVDNYKHCHYSLYPPGTEYVSSYIESRGGEFPVTMFVGLQAYIREYLMRPITLEDIDQAEFVEREQGMHFNRDNWLGILNDYDGYLPVEIEAVPEGTVLPVPERPGPAHQHRPEVLLGDELLRDRPAAGGVVPDHDRHHQLAL